jgi:hypothetical protein
LRQEYELYKIETKTAEIQKCRDNIEKEKNEQIAVNGRKLQKIEEINAENSAEKSADIWETSQSNYYFIPTEPWLTE